MTTIERFVFNSFQVNTYLVCTDPGESLVVDPSFHSGEEAEAFRRFLTDKRLKLTGQVNTHCHVDHLLGVAAVRSQYNCPFRAHPEEADLVSNAPLMGEMFGLKVDPMDGIDNFLEEGARIPVGDLVLEAIHVPGHSRGSLAFHSAEGGFVFTGDALFRGSIGRTDLPGGSHEQLIRSIREKLLVLPPETRIYPGHGDSSTIGEEMRENPFLSQVE